MHAPGSFTLLVLELVRVRAIESSRARASPPDCVRARVRGTAVVCERSIFFIADFAGLAVPALVCLR